MAIELFIRGVAVLTLKENGNAFIDAEQANDKLLEVRPFVFTEAKGNGKRRQGIVLAVQGVIPVEIS